MVHSSYAMTLVNALQRVFCELIVLLSCCCHSVDVEYYANKMTSFLNAGHCLDLHTLPWCIQLSAIFLSIPALILLTLSAKSIFMPFLITQHSQCTSLSAFSQLQVEAANYICLANSDCLAKVISGSSVPQSAWHKDLIPNQGCS